MNNRPISIRCAVALLAIGLSAGSLPAAAAPQAGQQGEQQGGRIVTYPEPAEVTYTHHNDDFTVRVRTPGGPWQDLYEYKVKVDLDAPQEASMVSFDTDGPVEVQIRKNNGKVREVRVRPAATGIKAKLVGNIATFALAGPQKLSIEFDGDKLHNLHLFANPIETEKPDPKDPNVIWFGPGVHVPPDSKTFQIASGKTVYIAGGAMLRGPIVVDHAENVRIIGRGIIDQPERGIQVTYSRNVTIDGPIAINPKYYTIFCGQSSGVTIRNLKTFSATPWSDGIDFMSCSKISIDDVFLRTSDDSIAVYGHRWEFRGDARDYLITNAILWADIAHPINIGLHGDATGEGEVIENLVFRNIDILEQDEDDPNYQGAMAISNSDKNLVRNVIFDTVRIDDFEEGQILNLRVVFNEKYSAAPGRGIENVLFRNISYTGPNDHPSVIAGFDEARGIRGIRFEGLIINGRRMRNAREANIAIGAHVSDVTFKP